MLQKRLIFSWETLPALLDADLMALLLNVHRKYVTQLAREGKIPGAKQIGKSWYVDKNVFRQHFEQKSIDSTLSPEGKTTA